MIRVFPRKTLWTPTDSLSFVGDAPLFLPPEQPVHISVTFTWDIPEAERLYRSWSRFYSDVQLGGPAFGDKGDHFVPGRYVRSGVVVTSRGCPKECPWCFVPKREGKTRELPIMEGWDVIDNNLLACTPEHIERVFEMLRRQPKPIRLSGGLDADMFTEWHRDLLATIRLQFAWFAADHMGAMDNLASVGKLMASFPRQKKRAYVLIGYQGESITQADKRLRQVFNMGFDPMAMLYRDDSMGLNAWTSDWRRLAKLWSRPAAYRSMMKDGQ